MRREGGRKREPPWCTGEYPQVVYRGMPGIPLTPSAHYRRTAACRTPEYLGVPRVPSIPPADRVPSIYRFRPFAEAVDAWLQGRVLCECRVPQGEEFGRTVMELVRGREALSQLEGR